jgi:hypothetical protein
MKHPWLIAMFTSIFIIVFGGAFLVWYELLDGNVINPPITFRYGVDPLNLQVDKAYYNPGDTVSIRTSFCKSREAKTSSQWALSDTVLTIYAQTAEQNLSPGCYPKAGTSTLYAIEVIPPNTRPGCDYSLQGLRSADIGGGRIRTQLFKTVKFCVTE